nr:hypothetical transcript [Hymenolepis microstoma]
MQNMESSTIPYFELGRTYGECPHHMPNLELLSSSFLIEFVYRFRHQKFPVIIILPTRISLDEDILVASKTFRDCF